MSYSEDLRKRAVLQYEHGLETRPTISNRFDIGIATLSRWIRRYREEGTFQRRPRSGGREPTITDDRKEILRSIVSRNSDLTLAEFAVEAERTFGVPVSVDMIFRAFRAAALTRKKNTHCLRTRDTSCSEASPHISEIC